MNAPDLDALSLDAAWERARTLEAERDQALACAASVKTRIGEVNARHTRLIAAVYQVIDKHPEAGPIRDELRALIWTLGEAAPAAGEKE